MFNEISFIENHCNNSLLVIRNNQLIDEISFDRLHEINDYEIKMVSELTKVYGGTSMRKALNYQGSGEDLFKSSYCLLTERKNKES